MRDIHLLQFTDTHLFAEPGHELGGVITDASLAAVIRHAMPLARDADGVLLTGDLVHDGTIPGYEYLRDHFSLFNLPVWSLPGNHDDPRHMDVLRDAADTVLDLGAWRLLLLNTWQFGADAGHLHEQELARLDEALAGCADMPVLVAMHHPPVAVGCPWLDAMGVVNADEFWRVIDRYRTVRAVVFGHIHQEFDAMRGAVRLLGTPSTCFQFLPESETYAQDVMPPGFRHLRLRTDGGLDTQVERI